MAKPIAFEPEPPGNPNIEKLQSAPTDHADALVSALDLLQLLHDRGVLNLLRGVVGAGDEIVTSAAVALNSPEVLRAVRNFLLLTEFFASIPPDVLESLVNTARKGARREKSHKPPGLLSLMWRLRSENSRHAASVGLDLLEGLGKGI